MPGPVCALAAALAINQNNAVARPAKRGAGLAQKFQQPANDAVRTDRGSGVSPTLPITIMPDRIDAEPLGRCDFPFEVIADHRGLVRQLDPNCFSRVAVSCAYPQAALAW